MGYKVNKLILAGAATSSFIQRENFPFEMPRGDINLLIRALYNNRLEALSDFGEKFFVS
jgi:hypothetical protein